MQKMLAFLCFVVAVIMCVIGSFRSWRLSGEPGWSGNLNTVALGFLSAGFAILYFPGA
jgi:hypothetical protein